ncbi:uncharacterized protein LY79DRAFT_132603 [Colletotrichum navitas]|uniref:Uncharacterized protein n=1 Tax=Colletotrichum navitas TaxID=681940 RepID=A0AAD8Q2A2_9PEZI|nr:uncharacterized protein LY79DRAFT_132603 [Colletotrichum navitas]KAK1594577.1 hypothetical protein LY79DRAFT_132603 [Colletotrichum navitas]
MRTGITSSLVRTSIHTCTVNMSRGISQVGAQSKHQVWMRYRMISAKALSTRLSSLGGSLDSAGARTWVVYLGWSVAPGTSGRYTHPLRSSLTFIPPCHHTFYDCVWLLLCTRAMLRYITTLYSHLVNSPCGQHLSIGDEQRVPGGRGGLAQIKFSVSVMFSR